MSKTIKITYHGNIVTALEEVAKAEIAEEIEDAQWEWRNRFN